MATVMAMQPYAPLRGCDEYANRWCNQNCPHFAEFGSLLARYDVIHTAPGTPVQHAWRCYARHTLDESMQSYWRGKAYCTREKLLPGLIEACVAQRERLEKASSDTTAVTVEASGVAQQQDAPSRNATPTSAAGPSVRAMDIDGVGYAGAHGVHAPVDEPRIGLVVAHCREAMNWLGEVQRALRAGYGVDSPLRLELHVYEKCDDKSEDAWPRLGWQHERRTYLQNLGEECYAYLHYLRDLYEVLPDMVIFLQGDGGDGARGVYRKARSFGQMLRATRYDSAAGAIPREPRRSSEPAAAAAAAAGATSSIVGGVSNEGYPSFNSSVIAGLNSTTGLWANTFRSLNDHQYIAIGDKPEDCSRLLLTSNCMRGPPRLFDCVKELNTRHSLSHGVLLGLPEPRAYALYANAQFGVSRDRIRARPLAVYENLLREFDSSSPHEQCFVVGGVKGRPHRGTCALFEHLWHTIMGEPPILDARLTMSGEVAVSEQEGHAAAAPTPTQRHGAKPPGRM